MRKILTPQLNRSCTKAGKAFHMSRTSSYAAAAAATTTPSTNRTSKQQQPPFCPTNLHRTNPEPNCQARHPPPPNPYHIPRTASPESSVYVLTLSATPSIQEPLTSLRSKYFPPHLNKTPAHITLFHALPHSRYAVFDAAITALARRTRPYAISTGCPRRMSKGVLVLLDKGDIESKAIRAQLLDKFLREEEDEVKSHHPSPTSQASEDKEHSATQEHQEQEQRGWLSEQDLKRKGWSPHWTVMNKVDDGKRVQAALDTLTRRLCDEPERGRVDGLALWRYMPGGRWEGAKEYWFGDVGEGRSTLYTNEPYGIRSNHIRSLDLIPQIYIKT
ncbi:hypothetical protein DM02DRAFT_168934 [Periconia macrospinosa]|uniref:Uncharacterized protein n=1 Tax=Periconia macrospinosa TaxID=97972 RepID=A0A2V1DD01_9PLEO|nr:hypothetical protein DM02DRAFT_168934 [Periconia macrospinosa]